MNILFLCVANSARSQIAEAVGKRILGPGNDVRSAGSSPSGLIQPWALKVLLEDGIDPGNLYSKGVDDLPDDFMKNLNFVVTLCAEEVCPVLPTRAQRLHWPLQDPAAVEEGKKPEAFRAVREQIKALMSAGPFSR